jgi:hypothetical protein
VAIHLVRESVDADLLTCRAINSAVRHRVDMSCSLIDVALQKAADR